MSDFFDNEESEITEEKEKNKQNQLLLGGFLGLVLLVLFIGRWGQVCYLSSMVLK